MADLKVNIGRLSLKNPVMTASGTFGYGLEFADFIDLSRLGGIIVKGTTLKAREGNPYPRMAETPSGMINAVGLQNKGVDYFVEHIYPQIKDLDTRILVNVSGSTIDDYAETAGRLAALDKIPAIELNISCPNVKEGGMAFGTSCKSAASVVKAVRAAYPGTLIVKLSPNVTLVPWKPKVPTLSLLSIHCWVWLSMPKGNALSFRLLPEVYRGLASNRLRCVWFGKSFMR